MDPTILQDALRLSEVLEGAIDTSREVGHIPGLQHELGPPMAGGLGEQAPQVPLPPITCPRPWGSRAHRNLRHGDRHVARLHRQLDALQQV